MTKIYLLTEEREHHGEPYDKPIAAVWSEDVAAAWVLQGAGRVWGRGYEQIELGELPPK